MHRTTPADRPFTRARWAGWGAALALTLLRLALAPLLVVLARAGASGRAVALVLLAGFASDVLDGVVARRADAATPFLRRLDSSVDTVFYLAVAWAAWRLHPAPLRALAWPIGLLLAAEGTNYAVALIRFRKEASYHAWSAKGWGLLLFLSLLLLFGAGSAALLPVALAAGFAAQAETLAITLVLPEWRHDVATVAHALAIRRAAAGHDTGRRAA